MAKPPDIVETVADAAENSWQIEITELGYPAPVDSGSHLTIILDDTKDGTTWRRKS